MSQSGQLQRAKRLNVAAWIVSGLVFLLVLLMRRYKIETALDFSFLPPVYSAINTVTFVVLLVALYLIRIKRNIQAHRLAMQTAVVLSASFLLLYVVYHFTTPETRYCGEGVMRTIYFILLISHIILAAVILPFILMTYIRGLTDQFVKHKKMARWVWPLWAYVALTGPLVYLMLRPCY